MKHEALFLSLLTSTQPASLTAYLPCHDIIAGRQVGSWTGWPECSLSGCCQAGGQIGGGDKKGSVKLITDPFLITERLSFIHRDWT